MCVYRELQQVMLSANVSPNFLYELRISRDEQLSGKLSKETYENILENMLISLEDHSVHSSMENFLSVQTVADKTIADGVEALIGAYLKVRLGLCFYNSLSSDRFCVGLAGMFPNQLFDTFIVRSSVLVSYFASPHPHPVHINTYHQSAYH
jgi:hypothetical protein